MDTFSPPSPLFYHNVEPYVFTIFSNTVDLVHKIVFEIQPKHSQPNSNGEWEPLFKNPIPGTWMYGYSNLKYTIYHDLGNCTVRDREPEYPHMRQASLTVTYCKDLQEITVEIRNLVLNQSSRMQYTFYYDNLVNSKFFIFHDGNDFLYLLEKFMYLDRDEKTYVEIRNNFLTICQRYLLYKNHRAPQFLRIIQQARINQPLHPIFQDEHLTNYLVQSGFPL